MVIAPYSRMGPVTEDEVDADAIRRLFLIIIATRCACVWLKAEAVQRHTWCNMVMMIAR